MEREEQLKLARQLLESGVLSEESANAIKADFPELAESEDERIRKEIITFLQSMNGHCNPTQDWDLRNRWLPYLKKQKEQKPAEWSEEDELMRTTILQTIDLIGDKGTVRMQQDWLKSLRPQPIQLKESYKEGFQTARHAMALAFIKYCDKNRPNGKMCLSNGECEEIENAFLIGDWEKIERYFHKYSWKPSEEQIWALERAITTCERIGGDQSRLKALCEQLKLM